MPTHCSYSGIQNNTSNFKMGILFDIIDKIIELKKTFHELRKAITENKTNWDMWSSTVGSNSELMENHLTYIPESLVSEKKKPVQKSPSLTINNHSFLIDCNCFIRQANSQWQDEFTQFIGTFKTFLKNLLSRESPHSCLNKNLKNWQVKIWHEKDSRV